jgi:ParB family chromosome partitioning protein
MSKTDDLRARFGANVEDSIGAEATPVFESNSDRAGPGRQPRQMGVERSKDTARISIDRIVFDPEQPRKTFDTEEHAKLVESLREYGQIQPIRVRWVQAKERFMVMTGERRVRAAREAGLVSIDCVIDERELSPGMRLRIQMVENCVRADVRPIEQAQTMRRMMAEEGLTQDQLAVVLNMSRSNVVKALSTLKLAPEIQIKVDAGVIPVHAGYELSRLASPEAQREIAARVESQGLSVAQTAAVVRDSARPKVKGRGGKSASKKRPKMWVFKGSSGLKVTVESRKGFEPEAVRDLLRDALARAEAEASPTIAA